MLYGLLNLSFWGYIIAGIILTQTTIAAVTLYLHRCQAHRGLALHPIMSHFFRCWLWLTTGMVTKEWVAVHRKHHATCETEKDPHSPQVHGIKKVLLEGAELYRAEADKEDTLKRFGRGTPDDWIEHKLYSRVPLLGIGLMFVIDILLFGIPGIIMWGVQMMWIPIFAAGIVNGIGHYWGYRNFETPDASRNFAPLGLIIGGEELHNNHHTFPNSAKFSVKWWEADLGWYYIKLLSMVKLAKVYRVPPKLRRVPNKTVLDADTVYALISNRFQIMSRYSKDVIMPVLREERARAGAAGKALFKRAKSLMVREEAMIDDTSKTRLVKLLERYQQLQLVYHYRQRLQAIWDRTTANQKELLEALQEWCRQAEATGIEALRDFSSRLKTYVPKAA